MRSRLWLSSLNTWFVCYSSLFPASATSDFPLFAKQTRVSSTLRSVQLSFRQTVNYAPSLQAAFTHIRAPVWRGTVGEQALGVKSLDFVLPSFLYF